MGQRSRKRAGGSAGTATRRAAPEPKRAPPPAPSRSEQRNEAARARLEPLGPNERPLAVTIGAGVALVLALANLVLMIGGYKVHGHHSAVAGGIIFAALMLAAAGGMWQMRYWAVLGFEALLGIAIIVFALFLVRASNVLAVVICLGVIGLGGWLFWKLVRVMARIQMPTRPGAR